MQRRKTCTTSSSCTISHRTAADRSDCKSRTTQRGHLTRLTGRFRAWNSVAFLLSFIHIAGLSMSVHTVTHYCPNCEEAIAARTPGSNFAQTLERSKVKIHRT